LTADVERLGVKKCAIESESGTAPAHKPPLSLPVSEDVVAESVAGVPVSVPGVPLSDGVPVSLVVVSFTTPVSVLLPLVEPWLQATDVTAKAERNAREKK
jgi:hypothetical protein